MKRFATLLVLGLVLVGFQSVEAAPLIKKSIFFGTESHFIKFKVKKKCLAGLTRTDILLQDVESVRFNSDRVGWLENSTARGTLDIRGKCVTISGTANNDVGLWSVHTKDGRYAWLNLSQWALPAGMTIVTAEDGGGMVSYGNYTQQAMVFESALSRMTINFNANRLAGLMKYGVDPSQVDLVIWKGDNAGWEGHGTKYTTLSQDGNGNWSATIVGMHSSDAGNLVLLLKNGTYIWANIDEWTFGGASVNLNLNRGVIEYTMN